MKIDMDNLPPIIGYNVKELEFWKLKFSDNARHCHIFHKMVRDGVQINGQLQLERGIPKFYIKIAVEDLPSAISVWLTPEFEKFLLCYHCCPEKFYHKVGCSTEPASGTLTGVVG